MGGVTFLNNICGTLSTLVSSIQSQIVTDHMHALLHAKSIEVDLEYYENAEYYDTMHRAQEEAPYRPMAILRLLAPDGSKWSLSFGNNRIIVVVSLDGGTYFSIGCLTGPSGTTTIFKDTLSLATATDSGGAESLIF